MPRLSFVRIIVLVLVLYMIVFGATFTYIFSPALQLINLGMLAVAIGAWAAARMYGRWVWYPTVLDGVLPIWGAAFVVAQAANPDMIRRALPELWWLTALLVGWYILHDMYANGALNRKHITDTLLMMGAVTLFYAFRELLSPDSPHDGFFGLPRVGGAPNNANLLAALLVPVLGIALGQAWSARGFWRAVMLAYSAATVVVLGFTYSRGGWLSAGTAVGVLILAYVIDQGWATPSGARAAWHKAKTWQRTLLVATVIGMTAAVAAVGIIVVDSLDDRGRTAELRTYLWVAAWEGFTDKPLTGNGLYSTPRIILDHSSSPPRVAQPHAHNFPLQMLSEFGILGGVAIIASLWAVFRAGVRTWRAAAPNRNERYLIAGGWASSVGFGMHNLFDLPAWTPFVALSGLLVLMVMTAAPIPLPAPVRRARLSAWAMGATTLTLLLTGYNSYTQAARYDLALKLASEPGQMLTAAAEIDSLSAGDPRQPVYYWVEGMIYAVTANSTHDAAMAQLAQLALARFDEAAKWGMDGAILRLNTAALAAQTGDLEAARAGLERAVEYAPDGATFLLNMALAAERWGMDAEARALWTRILALPDIERTNLALMRGVAESAIAAEFTLPPLFEEGFAAERLAANEPAEALALLDAHPEWRSTRAFALRALALHALGQDPAPALAHANAIWASTGERQWIFYAESVIEGGELPPFAQDFDPVSLNIGDESSSLTIARLHFLHNTFGRQIVPQVGYDARDFLLAALVKGSELK